MFIWALQINNLLYHNRVQKCPTFISSYLLLTKTNKKELFYNLMFQELTRFLFLLLHFSLYIQSNFKICFWIQTVKYFNTFNTYLWQQISWLINRTVSTRKYQQNRVKLITLSPEQKVLLKLLHASHKTTESPISDTGMCCIVLQLCILKQIHFCQGCISHTHQIH